MEQIDFHFGVANRTVYVAKLIKKVQKMGLSWLCGGGTTSS